MKKITFTILFVWKRRLLANWSCAESPVNEGTASDNYEALLLIIFQAESRVSEIPHPGWGVPPEKKSSENFTFGLQSGGLGARGLHGGGVGVRGFGLRDWELEAQGLGLVDRMAAQNPRWYSPAPCTRGLTQTPVAAPPQLCTSPPRQAKLSAFGCPHI